MNYWNKIKNENERIKKFPIFYDGKWYKEKDCGELFLAFYTCIEALRPDGSVYIGDKTWVYPNDTFGHD